jgi:predicted Ser/Thr protein kinase
MLSRKTYFSNGNRGVIYTAHFSRHDEEPVRAAVKELLHARLLKPGRIVCADALENEARWLEVVNCHGIGPKLLHADADRVVMEFVPGRRILEYLTEEHEPDKCIAVLVELLRQLRLLDVLRIHKGELVKPGEKSRFRRYAEDPPEMKCLAMTCRDRCSA